MPPPTIEGLVRTKRAEAPWAYSATSGLGRELPMTDCAHRWKVDTKVVDGHWPAKCKRCGTTRTYPTVPKLAKGRNYWGRRPLD